MVASDGSLGSRSRASLFEKNFYHFPLCFKFLITKEGKREEEEMCFGVSINRVHRTNKNCLEFYSGYEISTGIKIDVH